jgi:hypothetical protein
MPLLGQAGCPLAGNRCGGQKKCPEHPVPSLPLLPSGPDGVHEGTVARGMRAPGPGAVTRAATSSSFTTRGGEGGIRTRGRLPYTAFPMLHHRPLGHLSVWSCVRDASWRGDRLLIGVGRRAGAVASSRESLAERVGFEPTEAVNLTRFRVWHHRPLGHLSVARAADHTRIARAGKGPRRDRGEPARAVVRGSPRRAASTANRAMPERRMQRPSRAAEAVG